MPKICEFPSLDSWQKRFLALHPVIGHVLQADVEKFHRYLVSVTQMWFFSAVWKRNHSQNPQLLGKKTIKSAKSKTRRQQRKECDQNPLQFGFTLQNGALEWKQTVVQGEDFIPCPWRKVQYQWSFFNSYGQGNSLRLGCRHPRMKLDFSGSILSSGGYSPAFRGSPLGSESLHSAQTCWIRPWRGPYAPK